MYSQCDATVSGGPGQFSGVARLEWARGPVCKDSKRAPRPPYRVRHLQCKQAIPIFWQFLGRPINRPKDCQCHTSKSHRFLVISDDIAYTNTADLCYTLFKENYL